jgi:hypothetical protein
MNTIPLSLLLIGGAALYSGAMYPPGEVAKQIAIVILWSGVGFAVSYLVFNCN